MTGRHCLPRSMSWRFAWQALWTLTGACSCYRGSMELLPEPLLLSQNSFSQRMNTAMCNALTHISQWMLNAPKLLLQCFFPLLRYVVSSSFWREKNLHRDVDIFHVFLTGNGRGNTYKPNEITFFLKLT